MAGVRALFEFGSQDYAWSEAYYWTTGQQPSNPSIAIQPAQNLAYARVPCLGNGAALQRVRLSLYPASRQVYDILPPLIPTAPAWGTQTINGYSIDALQYTASRPWVALLCLCSDLLGRTKQIYMGGIPKGLEAQETADEQGIYWDGAPGFYQRLSTFFAQLNAGSWAWLSQRLESFQPAYQSAAAPYGLVTNAAYPGMVGVQTTTPLTFTDPLHPRVRIKGLKRQNIRIPGANGLWSVGGILPPTPPATAPYTYFLLNSSLVSLTGYTGIPLVAAFFPSFINIVQSQPVATVHRKRGVSLAGVRGRLRTRA